MQYSDPITFESLGENIAISAKINVVNAETINKATNNPSLINNNARPPNAPINVIATKKNNLLATPLYVAVAPSSTNSSFSTLLKTGLLFPNLISYHPFFIISIYIYYKPFFIKLQLYWH